MSDTAAAPVAPSAPAAAQATSTQATAENAAQAPVQAAEEYEELTVKGQSRRVPKSRLKDLAQRGFAADETFREAKEMSAKESARWEAAKADPRKLREILRERGFDDKAIARQMLVQDAEFEALSPAEREAKELKEKLTAIEAEKKAAEEEKRTAAIAAETKKHAQSYAQKFAEALGKVGIPAGPSAAWAIQRMAQLEERNLESDAPLSADELAATLKEDLEAEHLALFGALEPKALMAKLGPEKVKAIVQAFVAERQQATAPRTAGTPAVTPPRDTSTGQFKKPVAPSREDIQWEHFTRKG